MFSYNRCWLVVGWLLVVLLISKEGSAEPTQYLGCKLQLSLITHLTSYSCQVEGHHPDSS